LARFYKPRARLVEVQESIPKRGEVFLEGVVIHGAHPWT